MRPYTPLHAVLADIARARHVPLERVLANPEAWLEAEASPRSASRRMRPAGTEAPATTGAPIQFGASTLVGTQLSRPLAGDFDGDRIADLVARTTSPGMIAIFAGAATNPLASRRDFGLDVGDSLLAVADLDGDDLSDLIAARAADGTVVAYRSLGAVGFDPGPRIAVGTAVFSIVVGDVSGDGRPDLVALSRGPSGQIVSLINQGDGTFLVGDSLAAPSTLPAAALGDFDGDTRQDLAVADAPDGGAPVLRFYHALVDGTLAPWSEMADPGRGWQGGLAAADFDQDGKLDLADNGSGQMVILRGDGNGGFTAAAQPSIARDFHDTPEFDGDVMRLADFDQDGRPDVAVAARSGRCYDGGCPRVSVLFGVAGALLTDGVQAMAADPNLGVLDASGLASGDFNGDRAVDLVGAFHDPYSSDSRLELLINDQSGRFLAPTSLDLAFTPASVASLRKMPGRPARVLAGDGAQTWVAVDSRPSRLEPVAPSSNGEAVSTVDLNGDSLDDLVLANGLDDVVLLSDGTGGFGAPATYSGATHLAAADFDGALGPDLAAADGQGRVQVRLNDGTGHFGAPQDFGLALGPSVSSVAGADLDGDGRAELLVGHNDGAPRDTIVIHWSSGTAFGTGDPYEVGMLFSQNGGPATSNSTHPSTIAAGDFNGDGARDLFVVNATFGDNSGSISVLLQSASRTFAPATDYAVNRDPWEGVVADFDGDGRDDAAVVCDQDNYNGGVYVYHSEMDGTLVQTATPSWLGLTAEHYPTSIALGDWNDDGRPDLVVGNRVSQSLTFFENTTPRPGIAAIDVSVVSAAPGASGVSLDWLSTRGLNASVERTLGDDSWSAVASVVADLAGRIRWSDPSAPAGARVGYRLAWFEAGATRHGGEVWLDVPVFEITALHLDGARPNPTRDVPVLEFSLPTRADATLDVYDLLGRRVAQQRLAHPEPGARRLPLETDRRLAPGMYLARLAQSGRVVTARFTVIE